MMKRYLIIMIAALSTLAAHAGKQAEAKGDSIYDKLIEYTLQGEMDQFFKEKDAALKLLRNNGQWENYYFLSTIGSTAKVMTEGQTMAGLRECRELYEFARDHGHEYGRGVVMAQMGGIYNYIGDHEEGLRHIREAFKLLNHYPLRREGIALLYYYANVLELTGNYKEEAHILRLMHPLIRSFEWRDTTTIIFRTYRDNLLNAQTLLEVRLGQLTQAGIHVGQLHAKIAKGDEQDEYEALRAIAEYYKAKGDYALAMATTDRMKPLVRNTTQQWMLGVLRTDILRLLDRSDEAYDSLRPMIEWRNKANMGQFRQQLSDMETITELDQLRLNREKMEFWYAVGIALIIILALCVFTIFRHRAARRLKKANNQLKEAYDQLEETTTAKERIESDLRIARDIQSSMLPSEFPKCDHLDVFGSMTPAREVGGDLFDVLLVDDNQLYFCVGDVSGKGVPASLFMSQSIRLFRAMAKLKTAPADIANYMNRELSDGNDNNMFVTMFMGVIELDTGRLTFCNCGHNPPVIGCGSDTAHFLEMISNAPIGLWEEMEFEGETMENVKGQPLFIYSDGLNEAENQHQDQFGDDHMLSLLRETPFTTARQLVSLMTTEVQKHRDGAEPNDDLTMLCLKLS